MKLFDSELKVMDVLWRLGDRTAKEISSILGEETGWNVNTTYTVIKKCVAKGAVRRSEPNFLCHALVTKEEIQKAETEGRGVHFLTLQSTVPKIKPRARQ